MDYSRFYLFISETERKQFATKDMAIELKDIGFDIELKFKRNSLELLSTPYMNECYQDIKDEFESPEIYHDNCSSDPFIEENFIMFNSNQIYQKLCENSSVFKTNIFDRCKQDYYKINFEINLPKSYSNSTIRIRGNNLVEHKYTAFARMGLIEFMANIGGLFGLYLGMSFIDMSKMVKQLIPLAKKISNWLKKLTVFKFFRNKYFKFLINIFNVQKFIEMIDWKRLFTIMSIPVLIFQFYTSINDYLYFSTELNFEFIPYNRNLTKYLFSDFPAITVCNEHIFDKILFEPEFIEVYNESISIESTVNLQISSMNLKLGLLQHLKADFKTSNEYIRSVLDFIGAEIAQHNQLRGDLEFSIALKMMPFINKYLDVEDRTDYYNRSKMSDRLQGIS